MSQKKYLGRKSVVKSQLETLLKPWQYIYTLYVYSVGTIVCNMSRVLQTISLRDV